MVEYAFLIVLIVVNCLCYYMIDMYFLYAEALHTHTYKSKAYILEKKLAVKKFQKEGYIGL